MSPISRREFLKEAATHAAVAGALASGVVELRANPLGLPIGSQTYPHRALLKQDFPGLNNGAGVKKILSDHGLKCESAHFSMKELRQTQEASIAWAKGVGITQM